MTGKPECARINRHVVGDERALRERRQRIRAGWSLAVETAGWRLKRRQRYWWAGLLSFEKTRLDQDADSVPVREERNTATTLVASGLSGPAQSENARTLRNNMHENREI